MRVDVYVALVASLLLSLIAGPTVHRLPPATAVRLLVPAALTTAAGWVWALALLCWTAVGQLSFVAAEGHWSPSALRADDPVAGPVAWMAGAALALAVLAVVVLIVRRVRAVRAVHVLARRCCDASTAELVVVPVPEPEAFALPRVRGGRIVVSVGMLAALDAAERRVLLAHERVHLRARHNWWLLACRLAAAADPLLAGLPATVSYLLERWADEAAAAEVGDRRLAARALVHAGLAILRHRRSRQPTGATAFAASGVGDRVRALLAEPPRPRWLPVAIVALCAVVAAAAAVAAGQDAVSLRALLVLSPASVGG